MTPFHAAHLMRSIVSCEKVCAARPCWVLSCGHTRIIFFAWARLISQGQDCCLRAVAERDKHGMKGPATGKHLPLAKAVREVTVDDCMAFGMCRQDLILELAGGTCGNH